MRPGVSVIAFDGWTGRSLTAELQNEHCSIFELRNALVQSQELQDSDDCCEELPFALLLLTDTASNHPPVLLEDQRTLSFYSLPHEEKEVFIFTRNLTANGGDDLVASSRRHAPSSAHASRCRLSSAEVHCSLSHVDTVAAENHPLVTCLIAAAKKVEKQRALAQGVRDVVTQMEADLRTDLERSMVQDRGWDVLAMYCDACEDMSGDPIEEDEGAWVTQARLRLGDAQTQLALIADTLAFTNDGSLARAVWNMDGRKLGEGIRAEWEACDTLLKSCEELLGGSLQCEMGAHFPITQALRFTQSLDTDSKMRLILRTLREKTDAAEKILTSVLAADQQVSLLCSDILERIESVIQAHRELLLPDRELLDTVQKSMASISKSDDLLNAMRDGEGDLSSRCSAFSVQSSEFTKLAALNVRDALSRLLPRRNTRTRVSGMIERLQSNVKACAAHAAEEHNVWLALSKELDRRSAYYQSCTSESKAIEDAWAGASRREERVRQAFVDSHAEWLRSRGHSALMDALQNSSKNPPVVRSSVYVDQVHHPVCDGDVDDCFYFFGGSMGCQGVHHAHVCTELSEDDEDDYSCLTLSKSLPTEHLAHAHTQTDMETETSANRHTHGIEADDCGGWGCEHGTRRLTGLRVIKASAALPPETTPVVSTAPDEKVRMLEVMVAQLRIQLASSQMEARQYKEALESRFQACGRESEKARCGTSDEPYHKALDDAQRKIQQMQDVGMCARSNTDVHASATSHHDTKALHQTEHNDAQTDNEIQDNHDASDASTCCTPNPEPSLTQEHEGARLDLNTIKAMATIDDSESASAADTNSPSRSNVSAQLFHEDVLDLFQTDLDQDNDAEGDLRCCGANSYHGLMKDHSLVCSEKQV